MIRHLAMTTIKNVASVRNLVLAALLCGGCFLTSAQSYYDDDIYYNASKVKKEKQEAQKKEAEKMAASNYVPNKSVDFPAADTYSVPSGSTRDVDEYNRRNKEGVSSTSSSVSDAEDNTFAYTRRIEKYHNPEIVEGSGDEALQYLYYTNEAQRERNQDITNVNIYVNSGWGWNSWYPSWYYGWGSPWSWNSWYWNTGWWGPSWSYSWNWGPAWSWGWGPSWSWGWGPSWNWGWGGPVWGGIAPGPRPGRPGSQPGWNRPGPGGMPGGGAAPGRGNYVRHNNAPANPAMSASSLRHDTILRSTRNNQPGVNAPNTSTWRLRNNGNAVNNGQRNSTVRNTPSNQNNNSWNRPSSTPSTPSRNTGGFNSGGSSGRNTGSGSGRGRH